MPLVHGYSQKSFNKNISTEMKEHPDRRDQNLAIAYAIKRQALKDAKMPSKFAEGGVVGESCEVCGMNIAHCDCEEDIVDRILKNKGQEEGSDEGKDVSGFQDLADFDDNDFEEHDEMKASYADEEFPGDEQEDDDERDIVKRIMKTWGKTDRNPRPA